MQGEMQWCMQGMEPRMHDEPMRQFRRLVEAIWKLDGGNGRGKGKETAVRGGVGQACAWATG